MSPRRDTIKVRRKVVCTQAKCVNSDPHSGICPGTHMSPMVPNGLGPQHPWRGFNLLGIDGVQLFLGFPSYIGGQCGSRQSCHIVHQMWSISDVFPVPRIGCVSFEALALLGVFVLRFWLVAERRMSKGWRCVVETACMAHCRAQRRPPPSAACPPCISSQID